ncbi:MAG: acyltransferase [Paludibacteraceae bacterium]|nr:acyltransferase [Paludibacteraceae bacterium]
MKRDNCFDFLRFAFAFNVVLGHLTVIACYPELIPFQKVFNTYLSVTGFFVISGFLIAQSYERSTLKSYFIKRAKRLLPAYWFVIIACAIGLVGLSTLPVIDYYTSPDWWKYLGANLCFLNFLQPSLPGVFDNPFINGTAVNPALWTLKIEVGFYLLVPLLMLWLRQSKRPWSLLLCIYIFAVIYRTGLGYYGGYTHRNIYVFLARQLPGFMSYFAVGMTGYLYKDQLLHYKNYLIMPALLVFIAEHIFDVEILSPLAWGIVVLWCAYSLPVLNNFAKYGDISYGIYICHGPILKILLSLGVFATIGIGLASIVYIVCILIVGLLSWHLLEKRILNRK